MKLVAIGPPDVSLFESLDNGVPCLPVVVVLIAAPSQ